MIRQQNKNKNRDIKMNLTSFSNQFKNKYSILKDEFYGEGCFGQVYSCQKLNSTDPTIYCVKIIPITSENQQVGQKCQIENIIITTIQQFHQNCPYQKNLVEIIDIFYESYLLFIVMEQCDDDLQSEFDNLKENSGWYTEEQVFDLIHQIITGYQALYQLKIIHQDIKPENILIKYENKGQVCERKIYKVKLKFISKISDFGIGRLMKEFTKENDLIRTGTPNYSAPQIFENGIVSEKSDIYSLGVLFHQICYKSQFPYNCDSIKTRFQSLQNLRKNPLQASPPHYDKGNILKNLIERMIVFSEEDRIQFSDILNHPVMKATGIADLMAFNSESTNFNNESTIFKSQGILNKSENFEKRRVASISKRLIKLQRLLEVFYNRFKICNSFITQIGDDENVALLNLNVYFIANYQLQYALALIYIRPFEFHPIISQENDQLTLIDKLREVQNGIKSISAEQQMYKHLQNQILENFSKFQSLQNSIQAEYHKFKKQFISFTCFLHKKFYNTTNSLEISFLSENYNRKVIISVLQSNLQTFQKTHQKQLSTELLELLDYIIKLEILYPVSTYKSDIDLKFFSTKRLYTDV